MIESWALAQRQSLPLEAKVTLAQRRIREWHEHWHGQVYVAFSGGKDSTVLLHLVRSLYPDVPAVFCSTGLEFPEIIEFVHATENVQMIRPKMNFKTMLKRYGYPVISKEQAQYIYEARTSKSKKLRQMRLEGPRFCISKKWRFLVDAPFKIGHQCCDVMKKRPAAKYEKESGRRGYLGVMAADSRLRRQQYLRYGCNAFDKKHPASRPLSVWTEEDIWAYLRKSKIPYCSIYDMGYERTGCIYCLFTVHMETPPNRFQRMKQTHPALWTYAMNKLGLRQVLSYMRIPYEEKP